MNQVLGLVAQMPDPELIWKSAPPRWGVFLVVMFLGAFVAFVYRRENKTVPWGARLFLGLLRLAALLLMFGIFCEPVYESKVAKHRKNAIVFMVDESLSMAITDRYSQADLAKLRAAIAHVSPGAVAGSDAGSGSSVTRPYVLGESAARIDIVNRLLAADGGQLIEQLTQKNHDVEVYAFSQHLLPNVQPGMTVARGAQTRIGDALSALLDQPHDRRISAIVLLSDGQSNADEVPLDKVTARLAELRIPVFAIGVGSPKKPKDIELLQLRVRDRVLVNDKVNFNTKLVQQGFPPRKVVDLVLEDITAWVKTTGDSQRPQLAPGQEFPITRPGRVLTSHPLALLDPGHEQEHALVHVFDRPGVYFVRVVARPQPGEETVENNQLITRVDVRDDRLRVLYVEGLPRYEYRALMRWLIRDPKILAHVMLCSADPEFPQDKSPDAPEMDIWPPTKEQILDYHVVILGDVDPRQVGTDGTTLDESRRFLADVAELVEKKGGGLVLISGLHNPRDYQRGSPLEHALPVRYVEDRAHAARTFTEKKTLARTTGGQDHPIFLLDEDPAENRRIWENEYVGAFFGYQRVKPVPGASVLAYHPDERYEVREGDRTTQKPYPMFVARNFGRGKVFFTATDDTWRWRFLVGDRYFARFWAQVVRYVGSPSLFGDSAHYKLWTERREYEPLDRVTVSLEVLDREFKPVEGETWRVRFRSPSGKEGALFLSAIDDMPGSFQGALTATELGRWELWVERDEKRGILEEARCAFTVRIPNLEARAPSLNEEALKDLAIKTGGAYFAAMDAQQVPPSIKHAQTPRTAQLGESRDAWHDPRVFVAMLVLLCCEWLVRKINRLQ